MLAVMLERREKEATIRSYLPPPISEPDGYAHHQQKQEPEPEPTRSTSCQVWPELKTVATQTECVATSPTWCTVL